MPPLSLVRAGHEVQSKFGPGESGGVATTLRKERAPVGNSGRGITHPGRHLGDMRPYLGDMRPYLGDMRPHLGDMRPHLDDMRPHLGDIRRQIGSGKRLFRRNGSLQVLPKSLIRQEIGPWTSFRPRNGPSDLLLWRGFQTTPRSFDRRFPLPFAVHPPRPSIGTPRVIQLPPARRTSGNNVTMTQTVRKRGDLRSEEWHGPETMPQQEPATRKKRWLLPQGS